MADVNEILTKLTDVLTAIQTTQQSLVQRSESTYISKDHLQAYDESNESFDCYLQRLDNHLKLKRVDDTTPASDKICVQILIGCLSPKIYQTLTKLTAPELPSTKTYKQLIKLLKEYLSPQASIIAEQHKFYTRMQLEGEAIQNYVAELRKLTINCNFNCPSCQASTIDTHIRAQFIRGIRDNDIRERLLRLLLSTHTYEHNLYEASETMIYESVYFNKNRLLLSTHTYEHNLYEASETMIYESVYFNKNQLSFEEIIQIAQSVEIAKQESNQMQPNNYNVHTLRENSNEAKSNQSR
ncbi:hypothetical protein QE152_g38557 [Popillia japonica]|uniref:Retrotransposon gag domain-containing protein n=1 Tax=Popillia japonica TaxID=7064 RepID=A0AAW1HXN7_POPJA